MENKYEGFIVKSDETFGYQRIHTDGSGSLPDKLKGAYTTKKEAFKAIDLHLASKEKKKDGRATSTSRGN